MKIVYGLLICCYVCITSAWTSEVMWENSVAVRKISTESNKMYLDVVKKLPTTLNINTATKEQLLILKGVGLRKAEAIIQYRQQHGAFANIHELTKVKGISQKSLAQIQGSNQGMMIICDQ